MQSNVLLFLFFGGTLGSFLIDALVLSLLDFVKIRSISFDHSFSSFINSENTKIRNTRNGISSPCKSHMSIIFSLESIGNFPDMVLYKVYITNVLQLEHQFIITLIL